MTYFTGIGHPDREPDRNKYSAADRRTKFTEEVAATVTDGDLYFMRQSTAAMRFYVQDEDSDNILIVTHKFTKRFPDLPGKWEPYDAGGNLVIKVREASDVDEMAYSAMSTIESALYHTRLGRVVGRDALREMSKALAQAFGLKVDGEEYANSPRAFQVNEAEELRAREALKALLAFAPEGGYDDRLGKIGADADGVGFAQDKREYARLLNGESDGFEGESRTPGEPMPFLSQPVFYAVLGYKGNGRGFQSRLDDLMQAVGLDPEDV